MNQLFVDTSAWDELFTLLLLNIGYVPTTAYKEKLDILIAEHVLYVIWIDDVVAMERGTYLRDTTWTSCGHLPIAPRMLL